MSFAFEMVDIPGKGKGMIASRAIAENEVLVAEKALLTTRKRCFVRKDLMQGLLNTDPFLGAFDLASELEAQFSQLSIEQQEQVMALHDCHVDCDENKTLTGIMNTNCVGGDVTNGTSRSGSSGLCPIISRFNHSCTPNAVKNHRPHEDVYVMVAAKPIAAGEEICISYCNYRTSRAGRAALLKQWQFECACKACKNGSHAVESDEVREEIGALETSIENNGIAPVMPHAFLQKVERLYQLYEREGLFNPATRGRLLDEMVETMIVLSLEQPQNFPRARIHKLASRCHECYIAVFGPNHPNTEKTFEWMRKSATQAKYKIWTNDFFDYQMHQGNVPDRFPGRVVVPNGTDVVLRQLQKASHQNGRRGIIVGYDPAKHRYHIAHLTAEEPLDPTALMTSDSVATADDALLVKPENFVQVARVKYTDSIHAVEEFTNNASDGRKVFYGITLGCNEELGKYSVKLLGTCNTVTHCYESFDTGTSQIMEVDAMSQVEFGGCLDGANQQRVMRAFGLMSDSGRALNNTHGKIMAVVGDRCVVDFGGGRQHKIRKKNLFF